MSRAAAETRATASNSEPRAADGCGATSKTATSTEAMNSRRVWGAREARVRDALPASLLTEAATEGRPGSAPATAAMASPKPSHAVVVYPTGPPPRRGRLKTPWRRSPPDSRPDRAAEVQSGFDVVRAEVHESQWRTRSAI